ncbi:MAG: fibronectin type III domain-containing protein [Flavobacterium sp.]
MKKITLLLLFLFVSLNSYSQLYGKTEGFETPGTIGPLPSTWDLGDTGTWAVFERNTPATVGTGQSWGINTVSATPHQGVNFASVSREQIGMGGTSEDFLATSQIDVPLTGITELHFWTRLFQSANQGTVFKLMVAPAGVPGVSQTDPNSYTDFKQWTELDLIEPVTNFNVWTEKTVSLDDFKGLSIYVAFVKVYTQPTGTLDGDRWLIDDVGVYPQCTAPVPATGTIVTTPTTATLNWSNPGGATSWEITITPTAGGTPIVLNYTGNPPYTTPANTLTPNTQYTYTVKGICPTGFISPSSATSQTFTTQIAPPVCGGNLVDSGGTTGNYSNNENTSTTVTPAAGQVVTVTFTAFNTQANTDFLKIYDGPNTTYPLIANLSGTALPPSYTSTAQNGELTFVFTSNGSTTAAGYVANITCGPAPACRIPTALAATTASITTNSVQLNWTQPTNADSSVATMWDIIAVTAGSAAPTAGSVPTANDITPGSTSYILTGLTPATCYDIYIRAVCGATNSAWNTVPVLNVCTLVAPPVCGGNFVDSGGTTGNYSNNANLTTVICPTVVSGPDAVTVTFTSFNTQAGNDILAVYDGNSTSATLLASLSGTTLPPAFTSSSSTGCLTFVFTSNATTTAPGWIANVTCAPKPTCSAPTVLANSTTTHNATTLTWTQPANPDGSTSNLFDVFYQPCGQPAPTAATVPSRDDVTVTGPPFTYLLQGLTPLTCYDIYVRSACGSTWTGPVTTTTLAAPPECGGNFVDAGGTTGNYAANSNVTTVICPNNPGDVVTVTFTSFNTEATYDALYVYNGNSVVPANIIPSSNGAGNVPGGIAGGYWGTTIPCPFTSASANGCLTFVFRSDGTVQNPGWVANITCGPPATCRVPSAFTSTAVTHNSVTLNWTQPANADSSVPTMWDIIALPCGSAAPTATSVPNFNGNDISGTGIPPFTLTGLTQLTCYDIYIRAVCGSTNSAWICTPVTVTTLVAPPECGGTFVDNGGPNGNYLASSNVTTVICPPAGSGQLATVTFTLFNTEANWDGLLVYDGNSVSAPQIASTNGVGNANGPFATTTGAFWGNLTGANLPGPFTSTASNGCLTFVFRSDPTVQNPGFLANVTCAPAPTCARPVNLTANPVTQTSATLNWSQLANPNGTTATSWEVLVLPAGSPIPPAGGFPWPLPGNPPSTTYVANNLIPGTAYVFYVRAVCGPNDNSEWAALNFATRPSNDDCANASFAIVNQNLNCVQTTHGTLAGATASTPTTTCGGAGAANDDVWFTFTATSPTHIISFNNVTPATDISYAIYSGTCTGLTQVGCNTGAGLVAGTTYYIRVFSTGTAAVLSTFDMCIGTLPCTEAPAFCTGQTVTYANSTNVPSLGAIGCLSTSPNPAFFFLQVNQAGPLSYLISQVDNGGTPRDVDYVAWGPFTDLNTACTGVPANPLGQTTPIPTPTTGCPGTLHACSYSIAPQEIMCIPNAQLCQVYVIMITNFSNQAGTVTFTQTNTGGGTTACFPINTFNYSQTYYCQNQPNPTPVLAPGASAGTYTSTAGLVIDPVTGTINLAASTPGAYVVTSTSQTTIGGTCSTIPFITTTRTVIITAPANATISYAHATYCNSITTAEPVILTGTGGGIYSATPSGLVINSNTGEIIPVASNPGVYTVSYTIAATGGCAAFTTTTQVEILAAPVINQTSVAACNTYTLPTLTVGGYFTSAGGVGPITDPVITSTQPIYIYAQGANGCITEKQITVTINTVPTPTYTVTQSSCTSPTGSITVTSPTGTGGAAPADIFISEVTDADTGSLTYVELYNGTGAPVNLANYKLKFYTWGTPPTTGTLQCDLQLTGTIANNTTNVIKVSNNANIAGIVPNQTFTSCAGVNNNDNIRLTTNSGTDIDVWGRIDGVIFTPAGQTGYTYRRLNTGTIPSATWIPADWTPIDPEDYTNIGIYVMTVSNYQYSLDNGPFQSNPVFNNVTPGTHSLVVKDISTGCLSEAVSVVINAVGATTPVTTISYATPVCALSTTNPMPDTSAAGFTTGGTYSLQPVTATGITLNPTTGEITLDSSTVPGTYTIRYSTPFDPATCRSAGFTDATIVISTAIPAEVGFSYTTPICQIAQASLAPTLAAGFVLGGTFTISPATGATIDPATGVITLGASATPDTYTVTYSIGANNSICRAATTSPGVQVVISPVTNANVTFSYTTPVCAIAQATVAPTLDPAFTTGGTFTSNPSTGISINATTGVITLANNATVPGTYSITYTVPQNLATCLALSTSTVQIVISPATNPVVGFHYDTPVCFGATVSPMPILDSGFVTGGVFGPSSLVNPATGEVNLATLNASPGQQFTVTYTLTADAPNCRNAGSSTATISALAPILVELNGGCQSVYVLNATPVNGSFNPETASFSWENALGVEVGTGQSLNVPAAGSYTVTVTVDGCSTESAPFEVTTISCQIQKGISVNNDGFNDTFDLTGFDVKKLTIFNRYGMKVYSRANYVNEWGGKSDKGDELPDGTYFYVIDKNTGSSVTGWIYINRAQ